MKILKSWLVLIALILPAIALAAEEDTVAHRLFHIERNKNANIVVYDAMVLPDTTLPKKDPVVVYWLKLAEGGERKNLKRIEKKMAYGFKVKDREGDRLVMDMKADIKRPVVVYKLDGIYKAFVKIQDAQVILDKVYIFAEEGGMLPTVKYIELFGTNPATGEEVYEKFEP